MTGSTRTGGRAATTATIPGKSILSVGNPNKMPPIGFQWRPISDLARLESGHTPSRRIPEYWNGEIPWVGIADASRGHGRTIWDTSQHISNAGLNNSSTRLLPPGTVCLSRTASIGYVTILGVQMCTSQDFLNWVCGPELNNKYLQYALIFEADSIRNLFAFGSTHKTLYYPDAKALHLLIPNRATQDGIVEVLGALDDKVAINSRIVSTSVALAGAMQAETLQNTEVQTVPYTDIAEIGGGATPSTKRDEFWGGDVNWAAPSDVTALKAPYLFQTPRTLTRAGLASCSSPLYPAGSILMTSRATIGAFAVAQEPTAVNQGFIVVQPKAEHLRWWLFHEMQRRVPEYLNRANGATFLELPRGVFKTLTVDLPSDDVLARFDSRATPLHNMAISATKESGILSELRDTLLPALMDGTIRVKDAVKAAEEVL